MRTFILTLFLALAFQMQAQQGSSLKLTVATDSLLLGHQLRAQFSLTIAGNETEEEVAFPSFADFYATPGPTNFQTNIINGSITRVMNYTFYLEPKQIGDAYIEPASVKVGDAYLETPPQLIRVYPNPGNIPQQQPLQSQDIFGGSPWGNDDPFRQDFFGQDGMKFNFFGQDFNGFDSLSNQFFQEFFENGSFPGMELFPMMPDSLQQQQPKKRKTTRL
jgi:hypothetical protein